MQFVLDCSVTMAWHFEDESSPYADAVRASMLRNRAIVPPVWRLEVVNTLGVGVRRGRTTVEKAAEFLDILEGLPIEVDINLSWASTRRIAQLAQTRQLSAYDASYLELALRHSCPIAGLDNKLMRVARSLDLVLAP